MTEQELFKKKTKSYGSAWRTVLKATSFMFVEGSKSNIKTKKYKIKIHIRSLQCPEERS